MKSSIESFIQGYNQLVCHVEWQKLLQKEISDSNINSKFRKYWNDNRNSVRKVNYSGLLISMYGLLEEFVELLIEEYITYWNQKCSSVTDYPKAIQKNHEELSLRLLSSRLYPKYESRLNLGEIYGNLKSVYENNDTPNFNKESFSYHTANLRKKTITELFNGIGIASVFDCLENDSRFKTSVENSNFTIYDTFFWLEDNAERRNQISHTFNGIQDILDDASLEARLDSLKLICESLSNVLIKNCLLDVLDKETMRLSHIYELINDKIVCCKLNIKEIKRGDYLLSEKGDGKYDFSEILEIQIDRESIEEVYLKKGIDIDLALRCDHTLKKNFNFYVVSSSIFK